MAHPAVSHIVVCHCWAGYLVLIDSSDLHTAVCHNVICHYYIGYLADIDSSDLHSAVCHNIICHYYIGYLADIDSSDLHSAVYHNIICHYYIGYLADIDSSDLHSAVCHNIICHYYIGYLADIDSSDLHTAVCHNIICHYYIGYLADIDSSDLHTAVCRHIICHYYIGYLADIDSSYFGVVVAPSQPNGPLTVSKVTQDSVTLNWEIPSELGGGELTAYVIEAREATVGETIRHFTRVDATTTTHVLSGLRTGRIYMFRVYAENEAGVSEQSLKSKQPVRVKANIDRPSPPGRPTALPSDDEPLTALLSWRPPLDDGGSPTLCYMIERRDILSDRWARVNTAEVMTPSYAVPDLTPGLEYEFRVSAENVVGVSEPSKPSDPIVLRSRVVSVVPTFLTALTDASVVAGTEVSFHVIVSGNPLPDVSWFRNGVELWDGRRTRLDCDPDGRCVLTFPYVKTDDHGLITCIASNRAGSASCSATLSVEAPPSLTLPSCYEGELIYDRDECFRLKFPLSGFPLPDIDWTVSGRAVVPDLRHEASLEDGFLVLRVRGANKDDSGEHVIIARNCHGKDEAVVQITVTDVPDAPFHKPCVTQVSPHSVKIDWLPPGNDGGSAIMRYMVELKKSDDVVWQPIVSTKETSASLNDLTDDKLYSFRVRATNIYGSSDPSGVARFRLLSSERIEALADAADEPVLTSVAKIGRSDSTEQLFLLLVPEESRHSTDFLSEDDDDDTSDGDLQIAKTASTPDVRMPRLVIKQKDARSTPELRGPNRASSSSCYEFWELGNEVEFRIKYKVCEKIGRGAFTVVHRCYEKKTRKEYAARFIRIGRDLGTREMVFRELEIMQTACFHDRLIPLHEAYDLGSYIVMILEYISGGELSDRIVQEDLPMTEEDSRQIVRQICEGIAYLHRNKVAHLDLKPENILLVDHNSNDIKIIDFGSAKQLEDKAGIRLLFATPEFCAPEVVNYQFVDFSTDMWSIGVIAFVMLSSSSPFLGDDDDETLANVSEASWDFQESCWDSISNDAKDFITRLLVKAKEERMTIEDALRHPWLQRNSERTVLGSVVSSSHSVVQHRQDRPGDGFCASPEAMCWSLS